MDTCWWFHDVEIKRKLQPMFHMEILSMNKDDWTTI